MKTQDSMKPTGTWEVRRRIMVPVMVQAADAMAVERAVGALSGVRKVATDLDKQQIVVRYDASQSACQMLRSSEWYPANIYWRDYM